jgi:toxin ParE1/3/4
MKFRISSEAREDLVSVWEYSRKHWGSEQADLYIDAFMLRFVWLARNRGLWRPRPDLKEGVFSCSEKSHVIFFSEDEGHIDILRVLHGRMDLGRHLQ